MGAKTLLLDENSMCVIYISPKIFYHRGVLALVIFSSTDASE